MLSIKSLSSSHTSQFCGWRISHTFLLEAFKGPLSPFAAKPAAIGVEERDKAGHTGNERRKWVADTVSACSPSICIYHKDTEWTVVIWCPRPDIRHGMKTQTQEELCHATDKQACASGTHILYLSSTILHLLDGKSWRWMKNLWFSFNTILIINYKVRFSADPWLNLKISRGIEFIFSMIFKGFATGHRC